MKVPSQFCGSTMEDNSSSTSQNHNGQLSSGANVSLTNNKQGSDNGSNGDAKDQRPLYSIPGILHFIQHEWAHFELERSQWELDRAEFQVQLRSVPQDFPELMRAPFLKLLSLLLSLHLSCDRNISKNTTNPKAHRNMVIQFIWTYSIKRSVSFE